MIGFETVGNATITFFDGKPILSTDPWIYGNPYFGSWSHKYNFPIEQKKNVSDCKFIWLSHGHPDHIDTVSLENLKDKIFLIPDHYGNRIYNDLKKKFLCKKIVSNKWYQLSKNIRIKSFADWNQDACLVTEIKKKDITLNLNDGNALGWSKTIQNLIKNYKNRFLLKLINWADADMINLYNHHNKFILPVANEKPSCGPNYLYNLKKWNCNFAIPFSSFHRYSRKDSIKMNKYVTPLKKHYENFNDTERKMLPAFISWNSETEKYNKIKLEKNNKIINKPEEFGDFWGDDFEKEDKKIIINYFKKFYWLKKKFGFLCFKCGKSELNIKLSEKSKGIIFETPRNSLIKAISMNIFDDLLIGNFMKVKFYNVKSLYPDFSPYVAKYGDNGNARSEKEINKYFQYYKFKSANFWRDFLRIKTEDIIRPAIMRYTKTYVLAQKIKRLFL